MTSAKRRAKPSPSGRSNRPWWMASRRRAGCSKRSSLRSTKEGGDEQVTQDDPRPGRHGGAAQHRQLGRRAAGPVGSGLSGGQQGAGADHREEIR
ncbi:hypothetical protein AERO8C_120111 [Aeromonas veronii]|uniref:Uncharacterized protein n=1 Tax=Aeromonas veronii TaxID=654 RepID=A0A653KRB9_AERVE|nr:hypothetical protein AERO8C_120111 [Aeromonas veronii]